MLNGACLKFWSTTQAVRALSSGAVEYYACLKGASLALGFQSMCADLEDTVKLQLNTDSAAAMGMIGRRGLGKVRHIEVGYLWLQDLAADKRIIMSKVQWSQNPAVLGTKILSADEIDKLLSLISWFLEDGRSQAVTNIARIHASVRSCAEP